MAAPLLKAIGSGYSSKLIIDMLIKQYPQHASKIQAAVNMGFNPRDILKFVIGGREELNKQSEESLTEHEQTSLQDSARRSNANKAAIAAMAAGGGLAAGGVALAGNAVALAPKVLPTQQAITQQAVQRAVPGTGVPQPTNQIAMQAAQQAPAAALPAAALPAAQQAQAALPAQAAQATQANNPLQIAQQMNLMPHIQSFLKNYKDPKQVAGLMYLKFPKEMKKFQEDAGKQMEDAIADILKTIPQHEVEEQKPLEKGSKILTPSDEIGEIEKIAGKTAQIKTEDGKIGLPTERALPVTEEVSNVLGNYKKLIDSIPEDYKSSVVNFIGYDPERRKLSVRFHGGDQYNYEDLDEEDVQKIADAFHLAKTSGENVYGAWSPNDPSRGAGIHKLIKELQAKYGGKGKEYSAKFKTLYDYFALPKELMASEAKRKKDEERARKKAQKA